MSYTVVICLLAVFSSIADSWEDDEGFDAQVLRAYSLSQDVVDEIAREIRKPRRPQGVRGQGRAQRNIQPYGYSYDSYELAAGPRAVRDGDFQEYSYPDGELISYRRDACQHPAEEHGGYHPTATAFYQESSNRAIHPSIGYSYENYQPVSWEKPHYYLSRDYGYNLCQSREQAIPPSEFAVSTQPITSQNFQSIFMSQLGSDSIQHHVDELPTTSRIADFVTEEPIFLSKYATEHLTGMITNFQDSLQNEHEGLDESGHLIPQWKVASIEGPLDNILSPAEMIQEANQKWFSISEHLPDSNMRVKSVLEPFDSQVPAMVPTMYPSPSRINHFVPYYGRYWG
nr:PREDICTED: uncharacterized protein LOC109035739 [Bemisia tabaci]